MATPIIGSGLVERGSRDKKYKYDICISNDNPNFMNSRKQRHHVIYIYKITGIERVEIIIISEIRGQNTSAIFSVECKSALELRQHSSYLKKKKKS